MENFRQTHSFYCDMIVKYVGHDNVINTEINSNIFLVCDNFIRDNYIVNK